MLQQMLQFTTRPIQHEDHTKYEIAKSNMIFHLNDVLNIAYRMVRVYNIIMLSVLVLFLIYDFVPVNILLSMLISPNTINSSAISSLFLTHYSISSI